MKRVFIHPLYFAATLATCVTVSVFLTLPRSDQSVIPALPTVDARSELPLAVPVQQTLTSDINKSGLELFGDDDEELQIVDVKSVSPNQMLVTVNDNLYLLNSRKEVIWKTSIDMVAPPIIDSTGNIFGIRSDLGHFSVSAKTGRVSYFGRGVAGSHSYYTQIKPYKRNQYLVVENMQFYRDGNLCYPKCPMRSDALYAWSGQRLLWSTDFPPNAELQVWGNKILAVTKQKNSVVVQEIEMPKNRK